MEKFNPKNKEFHFRLSSHSCYKCKYEICPLETLTLQDINEYKQTKSSPQESDEEYCIGMAKLLLQGNLKDKLYISKYFCGHYSLSDGQHRICVACHLIDKNIDIKFMATVKEEPVKCYYCGMMDKFDNFFNSLTLFQKKFKTKSFRQYKEAISEFKEYNILRKL